MEKIKCLGCGSILQMDDKMKIGYTPKEIEETKYCQRCFKLINHLEKPTVYSSNDEFLKIIDEISHEDCLIVYLLDYFDFTGSSIKVVEDKIAKKDYLVVANKLDLIPKSVKERKLVKWFEKEVEKKGLNPIEIMLISAKKKKNIDELIDKIEYYRKGRNVYVVGATNTGKSTLINSIISAKLGEKTNVITTSFFSSTTLDIIEIPFDDKTNLIDTPGIINEGQMTTYLDKESLEIVVANKEIKTKTYYLDEGQALFLTGLCQMNFLSGDKTSFTAYVSNRIEIHRTKVEKAEILRETHMCTDMLYPPSRTELEEIKEFKRIPFTIGNENTDIVIDGLGWITVKGQRYDIEVEIIVPQKANVSLREALI